jgi:alpha,alpha-trehalase
MARKIKTSLPIIPIDPIVDPIKSALVKTTGILLKSGKDIDEQLGDLLLAVQNTNVYGDGKTFVDLVPAGRLKSIKEEYGILKDDPDFDLREFVSRHFHDATEGVYQRAYESSPDHTPLEHIDELWKFLERRNRVARGSLLALPYKYVVPGGRFNEQFYWDSYFIMLGLASAGKWKMIEGMMKNYAHMIRMYGFIPTANRTYFLSRSQPPFFSHMVRLLSEQKGKQVLRDYLPYLLAEYRFWMRGRSRIDGSEHGALRRVVKMPNNVLVNRYYDNKKTPRPESLREDMETAVKSGRKDADRLYLHLRAAAESGWDFSSRWFLDPLDIKTIHTADIVPVDLNSLLYHLEVTIADAYKASFNFIQARTFRQKAKHRAETIQAYLWSEEEGYYKDYNFHRGQHTSVNSLAGVFPLFVGIATQEQADAVADILRKDFLHAGGLMTTLIENGQQWDAPNGWAPLQWVAIQGLRRYGHTALADEIAKRWTELNEKVYASSLKFVEKYNVNDDGGLGGGGEYVLQDGFGWTNGVYEALKRNYVPKN